jgi:mannose-6-phosphate isomerase
MTNLYPIKFEPQFSKKIWGGNKIKQKFNKPNAPDSNCGESWEISAVEENVSIVKNGFLEGNNLNEIVEIYMDELVGETVFNKYGITFPLLIKFIEAKEDLSIQVHPNDEVAIERHNSFGKTEMWYVLDAENGASFINGFASPQTKERYLQNLENGTLLDILKKEYVESGDVFFIPAGTVHSIGKGTMVAEIQQTSDLTYRIFDFNRLDTDGHPRELHTDLALDVINFNPTDNNFKPASNCKINSTQELVSCEYFTTNKIIFDKETYKNYDEIDSFVIYMCIDGEFEIINDDNKTLVYKGETVLLPACLKNIKLNTKEKTEILEIYIK